MTDKKFKEIIELVYMGGGFIPANEKAIGLTEGLTKGEVLSFHEATERDLKFHRCYFSLLNFIYNYLPLKFRQKIPENKFYQWLKHLKGNYTTLFEFKDGTVFIEYHSISFGKMSQVKFKEYIKEQLPFIYENVIGAFYEGEIYDNIIETIEQEYEKFMARL